MYNYHEIKPAIFTEDNQKTFLSIRDQVHALIKQAGCVTMGHAIGGHTGSVWELMAMVDRLVELGEIVEVPLSNKTAGQHRIFTKYE